MNTYTFSISTAAAGGSVLYETIDLFDVTNFQINLVDVFSDTFPNYIAIDWGDGTPVLEPDVRL